MRTSAAGRAQRAGRAGIHPPAHEASSSSSSSTPLPAAKLQEEGPGPHVSEKELLQPVEEDNAVEDDTAEPHRLSLSSEDEDLSSGDSTSETEANAKPRMDRVRSPARGRAARVPPLSRASANE